MDHGVHIFTVARETANDIRSWSKLKQLCVLAGFYNEVIALMELYTHTYMVDSWLGNVMTNGGCCFCQLYCNSRRDNNYDCDGCPFNHFSKRGSERIGCCYSPRFEGAMERLETAAREFMVDKPDYEPEYTPEILDAVCNCRDILDRLIVEYEYGDHVPE